MVKTRAGLQLDKPVISRKIQSVNVKDGNNKENTPSNERKTSPSADEELLKSSPDSFFNVKGEDTERHETENDEVDWTVDEGKTSSSNLTDEQIDIQQRTDALWESSAKFFNLPHRQSDCDDHAVSPSLALSDTVS